MVPSVRYLLRAMVSQCGKQRNYPPIFAQRRSFKRFGGVTIHSSATYELVLPANVAPQLDPTTFPESVRLPSYAHTGTPDESLKPSLEEVHSDEEIGRIWTACRLAREVLTAVGKTIKPGLTTDDLDVFAHKLCLSRGAYPSPLNYHGFPKSVCTSVNNCACHGIPDDRSLKTGDMISVDITVYIGGVHGDCCQTFVVGGKVDEAGRSLVEVAERCLGAGLDSCGPGKKFSQIGVAIDKCARSAGFTVVPAFTGHGVGAYFHGPPDIYHVPNTYPGVMEPGMIFTVEPCITEGDREIEIQEDGWTANTVDNARAAQFEHTVLVVDDGIEVLTK